MNERQWRGTGCYRVYRRSQTGIYTTPLTQLTSPQPAQVTGNKAANGSPIELWTCSGGTNQKWTR